MIMAGLGCILALMQRDLLKAAILTGINGACVAFLFLFLLAPDVALTQAVVGTAIIPVFLALCVYKTQRTDDE
jgi:energy-converting hydrogenase B subunit D